MTQNGIERNKQTVIAFYNAIVQGDIETIRKLGKPDYKQHNPDFGDTLQGVIDKIRERPPRAPGTPTRAPLKFVRVVAEGDIVVLLRRTGLTIGSEPAPPDEKAIVDYFRVEDGLVAEHWDYQEVFPRGTEPPKNDNGRF